MNMTQPIKTLDVRELFNPVDCRSLGVIRTTLNDMNRGEVLEVIGNVFQQREIEPLMKKLGHPILKAVEEEGLVKIQIERQGRK
jgi:TusA-related sulfurtransferase